MIALALTLAALPLADAPEARAGMVCRLYPVTEVHTDGRLPAIDRDTLRELSINLSVPLNSVRKPGEISVEDPTSILAGQPMIRFMPSPDDGSYMAMSDGNMFVFVPDEDKPSVFRTYVMRVSRPLPKDMPPPYLFGVCAAFQNDGAAAPVGN